MRCSLVGQFVYRGRLLLENTEIMDLLEERLVRREDLRGFHILLQLLHVPLQFGPPVLPNRTVNVASGLSSAWLGGSAGQNSKYKHELSARSGSQATQIS